VDTDTTRQRQVWTLLLDDACRKIVEHLTAAQQPFLMLKGATIATWLYDDPVSRTYSDLDILIPPEHQAAVVRLLGQMGYRPILDAAALEVISPEEQPLQDERGVTVDLHVAIKGIKAPPQRAWTVLDRHSGVWDWAGTIVPALDLPARTLHLALHVAQLGTEDRKAVRDLALGLERLGDGLWAAAAELARELDAVDAFAAGLGLVPAGADLAERLGLPRPSDMAVLMSADSSVFRPAVALETILSTGSWLERLKKAWAYLFPTTAWLRHTDETARAHSWGLALARVRRPFRVTHRLVLAARERRRFKRRNTQ
jgi:hypothetical protein